MAKDNKPPKEIIDAWTKVCSYIRDKKTTEDIAPLFFEIDYHTKERLVRTSGLLHAPKEYEIYNSYVLSTLDKEFELRSRPLKDKKASSKF